MSEKPLFLYFNASGRAIPARIALFAAFGKDGWKEETLDFDQFKVEKQKMAEKSPDARLVSGALPQLTTQSGKTFCQTISIARWACNWAIQNNVDIKNLYPTQDTDAFLAMDESCGFAMEILDKCPHDPDADAKKKKREEYAAETGFMGKAMAILEKRMSEYLGDFLLGVDPCLADFTIYGLCNMIAIGFFDYVPATYLDKFPSLAKHMAAVKVCDWMKKYEKAYGKSP